jgi:hypothetical protein
MLGEDHRRSVRDFRLHGDDRRDFAVDQRLSYTG